MSVRVAAVVLNFNGLRHTLACLESLRLSGEAMKVIVVDNGSSDGSPAAIRAEYRDIEVIETGENLGFAGGCNVGIRAAIAHGASAIWLLNNDTTVEAETLTRLLDVLDSDPKVAAVGSVLVDMDPRKSSQLQCWGGGWVSAWTGRSWHATKPVQEIGYITGASMLLRRAALEEVGLFDERFFFYWEDVDLSYRLREAGWRLAVASDAIVRHAESSTVGLFSERWATHMMNGLVRFARKHGKAPALSANVGAAILFASALFRGGWRGARGACRGWRMGWRGPAAP